jgi:hypothetical protein
MKKYSELRELCVSVVISFTPFFDHSSFKTSFHFS